jgi:hypothetical protein
VRTIQDLNLFFDGSELLHPVGHLKKQQIEQLLAAEISVNVLKSKSKNSC